MELLRRALLVGCLLPGLWLARLAPLDPLLTLSPIDFAVRQAREAASVPPGQWTEAQRRRAEIALPVYIEEFLAYNVFPASGDQWDRLLRDVEDADSTSHMRWRISADRPDDPSQSRFVFFRSDEPPLNDALDQLAAGHGTTYVSISRPGGDRHFRLDRRTWSRRDFRPGPGFTGAPAPPPSLLYPFRWIGAGLAATGVLFFVLLPAAPRSRSWLGLSTFEAWMFAAAMALFFLPLVLVGGSVQALTRAPAIALPCWALTALGVHVFSGSARSALDAPTRALFVREGLVFLAMALGPVALAIAASMMLWNR
jgi:hypothetical protein